MIEARHAPTVLDRALHNMIQAESRRQLLSILLFGASTRTRWSWVLRGHKRTEDGVRGEKG